MFNIMNLATNELVRDEEGDPLEFSAGADAAAWCKQKTEDTGIRYQPRKSGAGDKNWRNRENARIASGQYKRPDYLDNLEHLTDHFLHLAEKRPGQLAYTKSAEKGEQDIQTVISFQGYVEAFYKDVGDATRKWIDDLRKQHEGFTLTEDGLKFATTPAEIANVYTEYDRSVDQVANSCMRYRFDGHPHHPTWVYGAGDLAVAYLENDEKQTTARALCWPEKKLYSRVYGGSLIHALLAKRGYKKSKGYYGREDSNIGEGSLEGAKLLRIEHEDDSNIFLVPYLDDVGCVRDNGKHLIIDSEGGYDAQRTNGWTDDPRPEYDYTCDRCDDGCDGDDMREVYINRRRTESWCYHCAGNHSFYCEHDENYYSDSVTAFNVGGTIWSEYAFEDHGFTCERTGKHYPDDEQVEVIVDNEGATEQWSEDAFERYGWTCEQTDDKYSDSVEPVRVYDGHWWWDWCQKAADEGAFASEFDGKWYTNDQCVVISGGRRVAECHETEARESTTAVAPIRPVVKLSLTGDHKYQLRLEIMRADAIRNEDVDIKWQLERAYAMDQAIAA